MVSVSELYSVAIKLEVREAAVLEKTFRFQRQFVVVQALTLHRSHVLLV